MPGKMRCRAAIAGQVSCPWCPRRGSARGSAGSLLTRVTCVRSQLDPAVLAQVRGRLEGLVRQTVAPWADDPSLDSTEACVVAEFDAADSGFVPCHRLPLLAGAATLVLGDPWQCGVWTCGRPFPGRRSRACTPTTPSAAPRGHGRRSRRCG